MYCPKCGREVPPQALFCPTCGASLVPTQQPQTYQPPVEQKSPGVAAVLAAVPGIFGLMGIGHIYVGKIGKGIALLILGILLSILVYGSLVVAALTFGLGLIFTLGFALLLFILWIYQIVDAYNLAKRFNREAQATGRPPW